MFVDWGHFQRNSCRIIASLAPVMLIAFGVRAQHSHDIDPNVTRPNVRLVTLQQAISLGAQNGAGVLQAKAPRQAAANLVEVSEPTLTQLPYIQAQLGPRFTNSSRTLPEFIVSVNQPITWGNVGQTQKRIARAVQDTVRTSTQSAELSDGERAAHAWLNLALADRRHNLRRESSAQARHLVTLAQARLSTGVGQPLEVVLAESELSEANALIIDAEGKHFESANELAFTLGMKPGDPIAVAGDLPLPPRAPRRPGPHVHPDVLAAESRAALAIEQVQYAQVQQSPVVTLGVQYQREGTGDQILTAVATVPLAVAKPWAFAEAQQRVAAASAKAEVVSVQRHKANAIVASEHELSHTRALYEHLARTNLPPLRDALRLTLLRYTAGESEFTAVSLIRQRLLRAEENLAEALADVGHAYIDWLVTTGSLASMEVQ